MLTIIGITMFDVDGEAIDPIFSSESKEINSLNEGSEKRTEERKGKVFPVSRLFPSHGF